MKDHERNLKDAILMGISARQQIEKIINSELSEEWLESFEMLQNGDLQIVERSIGPGVDNPGANTGCCQNQSTRLVGQGEPGKSRLVDH